MWLVRPTKIHKGPERNLRYKRTLSLTSAQDECGLSTPHPGRFTPKREPWYPLHRGLGGLQDRSGQVRKILASTDFNPRTAHPVTSTYTDCATPAQ